VEGLLTFIKFYAILSRRCCSWSGGLSSWWICDAWAWRAFVWCAWRSASCLGLVDEFLGGSLGFIHTCRSAVVY